MAKVATSDPWPPLPGEFVVGNPENCVAVATCGSHMSDFPLGAGASLTGPCKTENIGIEKLVANLVSNPNIRFLVVTGMEVKGHITGQAITAFHKGGIDADGRIIGAVGAIPFIQNLDADAIARFQEQIVEVVDLIGCNCPRTDQRDRNGDDCHRQYEQVCSRRLRSQDRGDHDRPYNNADPSRTRGDGRRCSQLLRLWGCMICPKRKRSKKPLKPKKLLQRKSPKKQLKK